MTLQNVDERLRTCLTHPQAQAPRETIHTTRGLAAAGYLATVTIHGRTRIAVGPCAPSKRSLGDGRHRPQGLQPGKFNASTKKLIERFARPRIYREFAELVFRHLGPHGPSFDYVAFRVGSLMGGGFIAEMFVLVGGLMTVTVAGGEMHVTMDRSVASAAWVVANDGFAFVSLGWLLNREPVDVMTPEGLAEAERLASLVAAWLLNLLPRRSTHDRRFARNRQKGRIVMAKLTSACP